MNNTRSFTTAPVITKGKILVTGVDGFLKSVELYDPSTRTWTPTGSMNDAQSLHTVSVLKIGQVLVTSGSYGSTALRSSELYDPSTETWTITDIMIDARQFYTALLAMTNVLASFSFFCLFLS